MAEFEAKNECAEAVNDDSGGLGGGENEWALQLLHEVGARLVGASGVPDGSGAAGDGAGGVGAGAGARGDI